MASHPSNKLHLLIFMSLLCLQVRAEGSGSIFFLDSSSQRFLRTPSSDLASETGSMLLSDVTAAVSVLLGFAPPASLSAESSSKLNEILLPNPFNRPRAVLMLEVSGTKADQLPGDVKVGSYIRRKVLLDSSKADVQLPDEDEVSVISLGESLGSECNAACIDKELHDLASRLGGSYVSSDLETMSGELTVNLASGTQLILHMSKKADREFIVSLVSLVRDIKRAMEMHEHFARSMQNQAELIKGCFTGIKALQEQYGPDGVSQQGLELFLTTLRLLFDSLQGAYQGQIVGVLFFNGEPYPESEAMLNVKFTSRSSSRLLEEKASSTNSTTVVEILLVRRTLAWITGIILLISTLLGIYFLLNMPLTRDTLLYSNVKLD
ncbi:hypothetical protein BVC80_9073g25 [Macleaya cordata]|uniref:DUF7794 domain-containing protein n=1 Tax=Macleaya cordata TaxID=56857 RepID=A0A200PTQ5_MACCD|nr:hypothetical protein BVC80_9073g25 [Macleaya cordata]